jgi:hypothetical protein
MPVVVVPIPIGKTTAWRRRKVAHANFERVVNSRA